MVSADAAGRSGSVRGVQRAPCALWNASRCGRCPAFADITALLDESATSTGLLVHTDAADVHRDRSNWGADNAASTVLSARKARRALQEQSASGARCPCFQVVAHKVCRPRAHPVGAAIQASRDQPALTTQAARAWRPLERAQGLGLQRPVHHRHGNSQESATHLGRAGGGPRSWPPRARPLALSVAFERARERAGISYALL